MTIKNIFRSEIESWLVYQLVFGKYANSGSVELGPKSVPNLASFIDQYCFQTKIIPNQIGWKLISIAIKGVCKIDGDDLSELDSFLSIKELLIKHNPEKTADIFETSKFRINIEPVPSNFPELKQLVKNHLINLLTNQGSRFIKIPSDQILDWFVNYLEERIKTYSTDRIEIDSDSYIHFLKQQNKPTNGVYFVDLILLLRWIGAINVEKLSFVANDEDEIIYQANISILNELMFQIRRIYSQFDLPIPNKRMNRSLGRYYDYFDDIKEFRVYTLKDGTGILNFTTNKGTITQQGMIFEVLLSIWEDNPNGKISNQQISDRYHQLPYIKENLPGRRINDAISNLKNTIKRKPVLAKTIKIQGHQNGTYEFNIIKI